MKNLFNRNREMKQGIIFYASLPKEGQPPFGGGEVGNLRTLKILQDAEYEVSVVRRLRSRSTMNKWQKMLSFPFRMVASCFNLLFALLNNDKDNAIVHISGFYGKTIFLEFIVIRLVKMFRYKVCYEVRGGGCVEYYNNGTLFYKRMFEYIIKKSDFLMSQGKENIPLLNKFTNKDIFYYPNFIEDAFSPSQVPEKPAKTYNVFYFGRIEEGKNTLLVVESFKILRKKTNKYHLSLVGSGTDEYVGKVKEALSQLPAESYDFVSSCKHEDLPEILTDKHFFIFPTESEGHSNALTEAMSFGIIPIVSNRGFNKTVVGNVDLLIDEMSANAFADKIDNIVQNNAFQKYSHQVFRRVKENYTQSIVSSRFLDEYKRMFGIAQK